MWPLLSQGKFVVYEVAELKVFYVIRPTGTVSIMSGFANLANVPELGEPGTVHVYDAKANANDEPAASRAFLVEFSSCNQRSFAQTLRRPRMLHCCIPSYDLDELLFVCDVFDVSADEVRRRVKEIGPSIRYILINDYAISKQRTFHLACSVKPEQLDRYIDDSIGVMGTVDDISACLLKVLVDESRFPDPLDAYLEYNVEWHFASQELCKTCLAKAETSAKNFVRNFITAVDRSGVARLKGLAGNFLELIVDEFLLVGSFQSARRLVDDDSVSATLAGLRLLNMGEISLQPGEAMNAEEAVGAFTNAAVLYSFCKTFAAVDFMALDFRVLFQITVSPSHPVQLEAIRTFCRYVKNKYPADPTVKLVFVVPEGIVPVVTTGNWRSTQSFVYVIEEELAPGGSGRGGSGRGGSGRGGNGRGGSGRGGSGQGGSGRGGSG